MIARRCFHQRWSRNAGRTFKNCLKVEETTPLESGTEHKIHVPEVGLVQDGPLRLVKYGFVERVVLTSIHHAMKRTLEVLVAAAVIAVIVWILYRRLSPRVDAPEPDRARPILSPQRAMNPALKDPVAREALSSVGADAGAEVIWTHAINNPDLPANERQDLIEDLNEEGFANPKHPSRDDLPLIQSRLELIDRLAPAATDDVNAAAFKEARKDLVNMRDRILSQPPPPTAEPATGKP